MDQDTHLLHRALARLTVAHHLDAERGVRARVASARGAGDAGWAGGAGRAGEVGLSDGRGREREGQADRGGWLGLWGKDGAGGRFWEPGPEEGREESDGGGSGGVRGRGEGGVEGDGGAAGGVGGEAGLRGRSGDNVVGNCIGDGNTNV